MRWLLLLGTAVVAAAKNSLKESQHFCEIYVECAAVAQLEERLCLGNSILRPYWLPDSRDKHNCHEKLRNDYIILEKMEEELDHLLTSCLIQNTIPFSNNQVKQCDSIVLKSASRFSYGRNIYYVPTHCFAGVERRRERECGQVRSCCFALSKCSHIPTQSALGKSINETRIRMRKRAKDCENGIPIEKLGLPPGYVPNEGSTIGSGSVSVNFSEGGSKESGDDGSGYVNVHITSASEGGYNNQASEYKAGDGRTTGYDQGETVGEGGPGGDGGYEKVNFPRSSNREGGRRSELRDDNGSLTFSSRPKLSFPDDKMAIATSKGILVVNIHERTSNLTNKRSFHRSNKTHDQAFEHALKNTNEYKAKVEQLNRGEAARTGLNSLLQAGQALGKVSSNPLVISGAVKNVVPKASGSRRRLEMTDDQSDEGGRRGEFVTSSPVIFVRKSANSKNLSRAGDCIEPTIKKQSKRLQVILALLGEKKDSEDMKEIKDLVEDWHKNLRHRVVSAKEKAKKVEIAKALQDLINQFDRVNLQLIRNATVNEADYPDEDDVVDVKRCEPNEEFSKDGAVHQHHKEPAVEPKHKFDRANKEIRTNEHGDHIVLEEGVEKVILSVGDAETAADLNVDPANTSVQVDEKVDSSSKEDNIIHDWSNEEYKRELEKYKREHHINSTTDGRNETSCDLYMRCRNQMHLAVDSCAWRFASSKILPTLAESAESLLYKGDEFCDPAEQPLYEELYEMVINRNTRLRTCLDKKNTIFFSSSICVPYSTKEHVLFNSAFLRLLSEDYKHSSECFRDANLIQEKCTKLRECCPNFDSCRQETMDITLEQAIISKTAQLNEDKQNCLKQKAREAFKMTLRELLGKGSREMLQKLKRGELGLDIVRGAQALARLR
ncbi:hypothetical protein RB195_020935 [Necator americanus]|uniref:Kunitz/Bovine pancreatic trypsin inhibitor domain protein n=1 Tax=Necator americanus TaxID=51031 RepID=A0ABR1CLE3_NECAM